MTSVLPSEPCRAEIGSQVVHAGYYEWASADWPHLADDQLNVWLAVVADPTLADGLALLTSNGVA